MHHAVSIPLFSAILLLGGLVAAIPVTNVEEQCHPQIICVDSINPCGIRYGGCYDVCDAAAKPVAPPCPVTPTKKPPVPTTKKPVPTTTKKPVPTTKKPTPTPKPTSTASEKVTTKVTVIKPTSTKKITTSTRRTAAPTTGNPCGTTVSVCWDGINECGMMYGGCFPDCKPWPTFTPPPCPSTASRTTKVVVTTAVTTLPILTVPHS